jgi:HPt (histidine-containing phosphotransfer) domain-containing protein
MDGSGRIIEVDFSLLEQQLLGDRAIVREVLALFGEHARTVLPQLDPHGSADAWRKAAHGLRGAALGIGANALAQACHDAEEAPDASPQEKAAARVRIAERLGAALADIALYTTR